jgi:hypothetical protein
VFKAVFFHQILQLSVSWGYVRPEEHFIKITYDGTKYITWFGKIAIPEKSNQ